MNASSSSALEPKMGKRKRDANGKIVYDRPSDLNRTSKDRNRPGRRNGSEHTKTAQKRFDDGLALAAVSELGLHKCTECHVTKSLGAFDIPAGTSIKTAYKYCRKCCDEKNAKRLAEGETKYTRNRFRIRQIRQQKSNKASLLGCEGYEKYAAACREANPENAPGVARPRLPLQEMGEKPQNHGMFALILS